MKEYRVVLFDLDHTLWDYDRNSFETLLTLYHQHQLHQFEALTFNRFHSIFQEVNTELWDLYDRGRIDRDVIRFQRFNKILNAMSIRDDKLAGQLSANYLMLSPTKSHLVEGAIEVLEYLQPRYPMYIITNGFTEIQSTKVRSARIEHFFQSVITSERAGHKKPAKEIFDFTLNLGGFSHQHALMVGDNLLTDIAGGAAAGIDTAHYLPHHRQTPEGGIPTSEDESKITYKISTLIELKSIL